MDVTVEPVRVIGGGEVVPVNGTLLTDPGQHVVKRVGRELAYRTEHVAAGVVLQLVVGGAGGVVGAVVAGVALRVSRGPETLVNRAPASKQLRVGGIELRPGCVLATVVISY